MASDFVFTEQVVDHVLAALRGGGASAHIGGLSADWWELDATPGAETPLRICDHGDLADYPLEESLLDLSPAILVRGLGPTGGEGMSGVATIEEHIRLVHLRAWEHALDASGARAANQSRARERYAAVIGAALFSDPVKRLGVYNGTSWAYPSLTTSDAGGARVTGMRWRGWDLGHAGNTAYSAEEVDAIRGLGLPLWAIACDFTVSIRTGVS